MKWWTQESRKCSLGLVFHKKDKKTHTQSLILRTRNRNKIKNLFTDEEKLSSLKTEIHPVKP